MRHEPSAELPALRSIRRGVFVFMEYENVNAMTMLRELLREVPESLEVVVADARCMSPEIVALPELRCKLRDGGEIAWVRHGRIVAVAGPGFSPESIKPNTQALLALP